MLFADSFSQLHGWLGFIVFLLQATLIGMILVTQWDQYQQSNHFLDVPFDVKLSTRIGQFAGMLILIFYQNDYWVSSSLFVISLTTEGGLEIAAEDNHVSRRNITRLSKWSTNVTCLLRLLLSVLVILSSTVLLIQSNNIIDLVKDYGCIQTCPRGLSWNDAAGKDKGIQRSRGERYSAIRLQSSCFYDNLYFNVVIVDCCVVEPNGWNILFRHRSWLQLL